MRTARKNAGKRPNAAGEQHIAELFALAEKAFKEDPKLSNRYVRLARELAMRIRKPLPRELKRRICKRCFSFLVPGANCRVRTQRGKVVYYCKSCKKLMRLPFVKERKERRRKM